MRDQKKIHRSKVRLFVLIIGLLMLNVLSYHFFVRLDLTHDHRHSIHPNTQKLLATLQEGIVVKIYLAGDLPIGFRQLQRATKELLTAFRAYAKYPIRYQIIDINQVAIEERQALLKNLAAQGIHPTNLYVQEQGQRIEKIIYPGALVSYQGQEIGVMLLKSHAMTSTSQMVSQSIENLEFEIAQTIAKLVNKSRLKIGILKEHGRPKDHQLYGLKQVLQEDYEWADITLDKVEDLSNCAALLIIKPQQAFLEAEKYVLDQYIMQGGKVLFFLDRLKIDMESLNNSQTFALPLELNLDDQLFKYGVRIKQDLLQDLHAGVFPIIVGKLGNQPQLQFLPWPFFPILNNFSEHIITKNLNPIYSQFVNSIDTVKAVGVTQTPLVFTSTYSRSLGMPVQVNVESLRKAPDTKLYNQGPIPVVYLLEGTFHSLYTNRLPPVDFDKNLLLASSKPTKILVAASGSMVLNAVDPRQHKSLPWGYDPFMKQTFANEDFFRNALSYMLADDGLINTKQKVIQLRYLDKIKVEQARLRWQLINSCMPILILVLMGWIWNRIYKRKYSQF